MAAESQTAKSPDGNTRQWAHVLAQAWSDESFKKRLVASPVQALAECGIHSPEGVNIRVVENTDKVMYLTLPARPAGELSAAQLEAVVGGGLSLNFTKVETTYTPQSSTSTQTTNTTTSK